MFFAGTVKNTKGEGITGAKAEVVRIVSFRSYVVSSYRSHDARTVAGRRRWRL